MNVECILVYLSGNQPFQSIHQSSVCIYLSIFLSFYLSRYIYIYICTCICICMYVYVCMCVCIYIYIYVYLSTYLSIYLSLFVLSVCLSVHPSGQPSIYQRNLPIFIHFMETGWSPEEGHPYSSMAVIKLLSDIKHLVNT